MDRKRIFLRVNIVILIVGVLFLYSSTAFGITINVPADYATIQAAIVATKDGDTVLVHPGTYIENINFNGKNIVLGSLFIITEDSNYISQTVIDGNNSGRVVTFKNGENSTATLNGFTIKNGSTDENSDGGGIYCDNSSPLITNNIIIGNSSRQGGGIACSSSAPIINNNIITNNLVAWNGGGIYCFNSSPNISNNTISENEATMRGGGIWCQYYSSPEITNNIITGNSAGYWGGGGINCWDHSSPTITNNTIVDNSATQGGGIFCFGDSNPIIVNSILWNNFPTQIIIYSGAIIISYSDIQEGKNGIVVNDEGTLNWLNGNIDENPLFVSSETGDFHLQQGSPCIDMGSPDSKYFNEPCPNGKLINLGRYGNTSEATITTCYTKQQMDDAVTTAVLAERRKYDPSGDGKIGLEEAINALQVVSGIKNNQ